MEAPVESNPTLQIVKDMTRFSTMCSRGRDFYAEICRWIKPPMAKFALGVCRSE